MENSSICYLERRIIKMKEQIAEQEALILIIRRKIPIDSPAIQIAQEKKELLEARLASLESQLKEEIDLRRSNPVPIETFDDLM